MALTHKQDIPVKPEAKQEWTVRKLFGFAAAASALSKTFTSPLDVLLGFSVFVIGAVELLGRHVSWVFWIFTFVLLLLSFAERHKKVTPEEEDKK